MIEAVYKPTFWWYNFVMKHVPGQVYDLYVTLKGDTVDCIRAVRELLTTDPAGPFGYVLAKTIVDLATPVNPSPDASGEFYREVQLLKGVAPARLRELFKQHKIQNFRIEVNPARYPTID